MGQTMEYQNNGADHGVPEQWGRPWGTRTMGQTMGYQNNGADDGIPEQWGQTMGYQNNGGRPGCNNSVWLFPGNIIPLQFPLFHYS